MENKCCFEKKISDICVACAAVTSVLYAVRPVVQQWSKYKNVTGHDFHAISDRHTDAVSHVRRPSQVVRRQEPTGLRRSPLSSFLGKRHKLLGARTTAARTPLANERHFVLSVSLLVRGSSLAVSQMPSQTAG